MPCHQETAQCAFPWRTRSFQELHCRSSGSLNLPCDGVTLLYISNQSGMSNRFSLPPSPIPHHAERYSAVARSCYLYHIIPYQDTIINNGLCSVFSSISLSEATVLSSRSRHGTCDIPHQNSTSAPTPSMFYYRSSETQPVKSVNNARQIK